MFAAFEKVNEINNVNNIVAWFMDELVKKGLGRETNTWKKSGTGTILFWEEIIKQTVLRNGICLLQIDSYYWSYDDNKQPFITT